ncbi:glutamate racemase [Priestia megaterium]|nr:glutamate racemase [Priestia megaterium]
MDMRIGVFDSGVGGLTVVREIQKYVSHADILYIADSGNLPYGTKSKEELTVYVDNILDSFEAQEVNLIIFACNTATSLLLEDMRKSRETPMIGVIEAGAYLATRRAKKGIGVIATPNTIFSKAYEDAIHRKNESIDVYGIPCFELVNIIEKECTQESYSLYPIKQELSAVPLSRIDTLVLGCTHYPLVEKEIQQITGEEVQLINPALEVAKEVLYLSAHYEKGEGGLYIYTSGSIVQFQAKAEAILSQNCKVYKYIHKEKSF